MGYIFSTSSFSSGSSKLSFDCEKLKENIFILEKKTNLFSILLYTLKTEFIKPIIAAWIEILKASINKIFENFYFGEVVSVMVICIIFYNTSFMILIQIGLKIGEYFFKYEFAYPNLNFFELKAYLGKIIITLLNFIPTAAPTLPTPPPPPPFVNNYGQQQQQQQQIYMQSLAPPLPPTQQQPIGTSPLQPDHLPPTQAPPPPYVNINGQQQQQQQIFMQSSASLLPQTQQQQQQLINTSPPQPDYLPPSPPPPYVNINGQQQQQQQPISLSPPVTTHNVCSN